MRRAAIVVVVAVAVAAAVVAYFTVGWDRMVSECDLRGEFAKTLIQPGEDGTIAPFSVSYSWGIPGGFSCTYSDGTERMSWWF